MQFDFDFTKPVIEPEPQQDEPIRGEVIAFPFARHVSAYRFGARLRGLNEADFRSLWSRHTAELVRERMASGLSREAARADITEWGKVAYAECFNPAPICRPVSRFEALLHFDFSKPLGLEDDQNRQSRA